MRCTNTRGQPVSLLVLEHFAKQFRIHQLERDVVAFTDLNLNLEAGQFVRVSGANGAGKSTLLRCLFRSYLPSSGRAIFSSLRGEIDLARAADEDVNWLRRHEIGYVAQFLRPRPRVSALELVAEPLVQSGISRPSARDRAEEMLDAFGLKPELWQAYPTTFSGGEQQKVNLARALIAPRRLLLLDEPTASLDASARAALRSRLEVLKAQGVAMLGVFHHPEDVTGLVDGELEVTRPESDDERELEDILEASYVAH